MQKREMKKKKKKKEILLMKKMIRVKREISRSGDNACYRNNLKKHAKKCIEYYSKRKDKKGVCSILV